MAKQTKIRNSARGEDCSLRLGHCSDPETVVFCHLDTRYKGMGIKSPDLFGLFGCYECHLKLDSYQVSAEDKLRALIETQMKLLEKGLISIN